MLGGGKGWGGAGRAVEPSGVRGGVHSSASRPWLTRLRPLSFAKSFMVFTNFSFSMSLLQYKDKDKDKECTT